MSAEEWAGGAVSHPVMGCVEVLTGALDDVAGVDATWLPPADKRRALLDLGRVAARVEELRLRVLAAGDDLGDVAEADGARDAGAWLAHHGHLDAPRARGLARLAGELARSRPRIAAALARGSIDLARAQVVAASLRDLPPDLEPELVARAEEHLVAQAEHFDPRRLRVLGRRVLDHLAPEVAEAHEARALAAEEAHAHAVAFLRTVRRGDGTTDVHARLADPLVDRLLTHLHAFTSPRRAARHETDGASPVGATPDRRPHDQRLAHAFGALVETLDPQRLPVHGGEATTVVVTVPLDALRAEVEQAGLARVGDTPLSAAHARRLACTARVLPAVLGADSQVLDLGRSRRLFSRAQRTALTLTHPTCAAEGCDIPAPWCEAHHAGAPWASGGRTDLAEGTLLCSHHHHRAHDHRYTHTRHPDGSIRFHRRQ